MHIPRIPVGQWQGKNWSSAGGNGKGSWPPRNLSEGFKENFALINWEGDPAKRSSVDDIRNNAVHTRIVHRDDKKIETIRTTNDRIFEITTPRGGTPEVVEKSE